MSKSWLEAAQEADRLADLIRLRAGKGVHADPVAALKTRLALAEAVENALETQRVNYGGELGACFCPAAWLRRDHHPRCEQATDALAEWRAAK